jgi:hypothetical protein
VNLFYMTTYLLDVICTWNVFSRMHLNLHVSESLVNVYFQMLWENK